MEAIILAAGYSSRAKTNKMALKIDDKPILGHVIESFYQCCHKIIVVGGHYYDETKTLVSSYGKVKLVNNENYDKGMFSSIKVGVSETSKDFFITPGDYPLINQTICNEMAKQFNDIKKKGCEILIPSFDNRRGHPILLKKDLRDRLLNCSDDYNLKSFRDSCKLDYIKVNHEGVLLDVDTMNDYQNILKMKDE